MTRNSRSGRTTLSTRVALLLVVATLLPVLAPRANAAGLGNRPPQFGVEAGSKPFLAAAGGVAAVADVPINSWLEGAVVLDVWTVSAAGTTADGATRRMTELVLGVRLEAAAHDAHTGIGLGVHGVAAAWTDRAFRNGSPLGAGFLSAEIFHPFTVVAGPPALTLLPGLSAYFSLGPGGVSGVPDILPSLRLRLLW
jgi:hypothetical protein